MCAPTPSIILPADIMLVQKPEASGAKRRGGRSKAATNGGGPPGLKPNMVRELSVRKVARLPTYATLEEAAEIAVFCAAAASMVI